MNRATFRIGVLLLAAIAGGALLGGCPIPQPLPGVGSIDAGLPIMRSLTILREQVESRYRLAGLETGNARMQEAINMAARAAASRATMLVHGESGTGK